MLGGAGFVGRGCSTVALCLWLATTGRALAAPQVTLAAPEWQPAAGSDPTDGLRDALLAWHRAWTARDLPACGALLADDALRVVQGRTEPEQGKAAILAALPEEWAEFEQNARGGSALNVVLRQVHVRVRGNAALIRYEADVAGGTRWDFDDSGALAAMFRRHDARGPWQLVFQADVWNLDVPDPGTPSRTTFAFDYALPVADLARAVAFYTPLLGVPEAVVDGVAVFQVSGSRLFLDSTHAAPGAAPQRGLPNGWPIVAQVDYAAARREAARAGVAFEAAPRAFAGRQVLYGFDPAGNLVALAAPSADPAGAHGPGAAWTADAVRLDATRTRNASWAAAATDPSAAPPDTFASLQMSTAATVTAGPWFVVARARTQTGPAPWRQQAHALESLVFEAASAKVALELVAASGPRAGLALDFDYAGVPVAKRDWAREAAALDALTGHPEHYEDEDWRGSWGERAVLGMFVADPATDGLPRAHAASTYLSFGVRDIAAALAFAQRAGAALPVVPAINSKPGIDRNPGYLQVYLSDSEGNGIVLTEYTGRRAR